MNKRFDVLVVGELNVDLILDDIASLPSVGKEVLANKMTLTLGSSSAIFAANLSTLGTVVRFIGKTGDDQFADLIIKSLQQKNINTEKIARSRDFQTGATVVLNYHEDRANITYPGAMAHLTMNDIDHDSLLTSRHLHVSSVFLQTGLKKDIVSLFRLAKEAGLTTSLDPQWDPAEQWDLDLKELLLYVDLFMPNAAELQALLHTRDLNTALSMLPGFSNNLVIKNGNEGAYLWDGQQLKHQPAFINDCVADCIGAGDSFNAGFVHHFLLQKPMNDCLEFAAVMGAVNTTRHGGTGAYDSLNLVKNIAKSTFNYSF